ncbi:MAG: hypothetical protein AAFX87_17890 [Bacteroidota bacterium]
MKRLTILSIIFSSLFGTAYAGGGWTEKKGKGFVKFGQSVIRSDRFFNPEGSITRIPTIGLYTTSVYLEYGFTDRLNLISYVPFFTRITQNEEVGRQSGRVIGEGDFENNIGDIQVGLKYGLIQNKSIVVSASLILGLPTGADVGGNSGILQTGDGEFNQLLRIEASRSFYPAPFYATVSAGLNNRTNNFSDEYHFGLEIGYTKNKFTGIFKLNGVESFKNGDALGSGGNAIFANDTEFIAYGPEVAYSFNSNIGISAGALFSIRGEKILADPNYSAGVFFKF